MVNVWRFCLVRERDDATVRIALKMDPHTTTSRGYKHRVHTYVCDRHISASG